MQETLPPTENVLEDTVRLGCFVSQSKVSGRQRNNPAVSSRCSSLLLLLLLLLLSLSLYFC